MKRAVRRVKKAPLSAITETPGVLEVVLPIVMIAALIFVGMMLGTALSHKPYVYTDCETLRKYALADFENADTGTELEAIRTKYNLAVQVCNQEAP